MCGEKGDCRLGDISGCSFTGRFDRSIASFQTMPHPHTHTPTQKDTHTHIPTHPPTERHTHAPPPPHRLTPTRTGEACTAGRALTSATLRITSRMTPFPLMKLRDTCSLE